MAVIQLEEENSIQLNTNIHLLFLFYIGKRKALDSDDKSGATSPKKSKVENGSGDVSGSNSCMTEEDKRLTLSYRRVHFEGVERFWLYARRMQKTVNFQAKEIPFLLRRLALFYTYSGLDLGKIEESMEYVTSVLRNAKEEIAMSSVVVDTD
jgi:hypothetical protein